jgi:farnesyl-diphosphate farnesyltransferase
MVRSDPLLTTLLRGVSRSFYLTLRVLPRAVRSQIGTAYLLARATDTIADTNLIPVEERLSALNLLRQAILDPTSLAPDFTRLADAQLDGASPAERTLLLQIGPCLQLLRRCIPADQKEIQEVLETIIGGQVLDLQRFELSHPTAVDSSGSSTENVSQPPNLEPGTAPDAPKLRSLEHTAELDDYTYRVAGCVGEFWTRLCQRHLFPCVQTDSNGLVADGIRFGKGLQLVNILRDLPRDLRAGRCYIPATELLTAGLTPVDLLKPAVEPQFRPVYNAWLDTADAHLQAGWRYTLALPHNERRLRLACALPLLIGIQTLEKLRIEPVLDPSHRVKVSRRDVKRHLTQSVLGLLGKTRWQNLFDNARSPAPSIK